MSKIKFWNSVHPSGPLVIQNIEQGFVPLQKQYQLRYSVRYSILAEHSNLQHLLLYRIFSATREGYFDPTQNHYFRVFIPCTMQGSLVCTEFNTVQEVTKQQFFDETAVFFERISCVVKNLTAFLEAVKQKRVFMVSFNDLVIFNAAMGGYKKLIPMVNWQNSSELEQLLYNEQGECSTTVDIPQIGGADSFGNPIEFSKTRGGTTQMGDAIPRGQSIPNQPANFGQASQLNQTNQAIFKSQPERNPNSQASTDLLSFTNQAVQSSQSVQMSQIGHPGLTNQIHLDAEPPKKDLLVTAVLKPAQPSHGNVQGYTQPGAWLSSAQAPCHRGQPWVQEPPEECQVVLEVHKPVQSKQQVHSQPRLNLPKALGQTIAENLARSQAQTITQAAQGTSRSVSLQTHQTTSQSIAQGAQDMNRSRSLQMPQQGLSKSRFQNSGATTRTTASLPCLLCKKRNMHAVALQNHLAMVHFRKQMFGKMEKIKMAILQATECPIYSCGFVGNNNLHAMLHYAIHHKAINKILELYPKKVTTLIDSIVGKYGVNDIQCNLCQIKFRNKQLLGTHIGAVHRKLEEFLHEEKHQE